MTIDEWQPISTPPAAFVKVDVWMNLQISAERAFAEDAFRVTDAWIEKGHWYHDFGRFTKQLLGEAITHWRPIPDGPLAP